jgi:hypothetical protein
VELDDTRAECTALGVLGGSHWAAGEIDAASSTFERQLELARAIGDRDDALASWALLERRIDAAARLEARFLLFRATGDTTHLREAKSLLDRALELASPEVRPLMRERLRLHRDVLAEWPRAGER